MSRSYEKLSSLAEDLTLKSLEDAVGMVGPSMIYELTVSRPLFMFAKRMLHDMWRAQAKENPFMPHVNLHIDDGFKPSEWALSGNGKSVGSEGWD